tara:strand:- start:2082 stop:2525 length:444 start_codon:yes stop_codon:yes gene_type:complete
MDDYSFLSVRIPDGKKRLVKEIAARKKKSIQELVGDLIDDFLERENTAVPSLAATINDLRGQKERFEDLGVIHMDLFGSIARNEAQSDSDIDIAVEFEQKSEMTLSKFASLQAEICEILNREIDLSERKKLMPEIKRGFDMDAIRVF